MNKNNHFLFTKTNKDCFKNIISFLYPSKEQIQEWYFLHFKKSNCNHLVNLNYCHINKHIYLYKCNCKNNYLNVIKNVGDYYNYFKSYNYFKLLLKHNSHYKSFFHYIKFQIYI